MTAEQAKSEQLIVDRLHAEHVPAAAELIALCTGGSAAKSGRRLKKLLATDGLHDWACVALVGQQLVGEARATYFTAPPGCPSNVAPEGWYLLGLNVHPAHRRRGIGTLLSEYRLAWLRGRTTQVWYFTNVHNHASSALHQRLGFEPVTQDFWFPRASFGGGRGVLYRLQLPAAVAVPSPSASGTLGTVQASRSTIGR